MQSIRCDLDEIWKKGWNCAWTIYTRTQTEKLLAHAQQVVYKQQTVGRKSEFIDKSLSHFICFSAFVGIVGACVKTRPSGIESDSAVWRLRNNHFARSGVSGICSTCLFSVFVVVVVRRVGAKAKPTANKYENRKLFVSSVFVNGRSMNEFRLFNCLVIFGWSAFLRFKRRKEKKSKEISFVLTRHRSTINWI